MVKKTLLLVSLLGLVGCLQPTLAIRGSLVKIKEPPPSEVSFRGYLKTNDFEFLSPSETTTLTKIVHPQDLNRICKGLGGTFYVSKVKTFTSVEGQKTVYEEVPYEQLGNYGGKIAQLTCKSPTGEVLFKEVESFFTGTEFDRRFATKCYLMLFEHVPEKHFNYTDGVKLIEQQRPTSLMDLIKFFKGQPQPDGSFKIIPKSEEICTPFTYLKKVDVFHAYCLSKGGEFQHESGTKYERFVLDIVRKFNGTAKWGGEMKKYKYICKGPEPFVIKPDITEYITEGVSKAYPMVQYIVMPGEFVPSQTYVETLVQPQTQRHQYLDPVIEKLLLDTVSSKSPQSYVKGALHYTTQYNYAEGMCHYISLIERIGSSTRPTVENYSVCDNVITPLGQEQDYVFGAPEDVKEKARQIARNCSTYGSSTLHYNNFRIDCKVLNPNQPCLIETTITRAGRLIEKQTLNACK